MLAAEQPGAAEIDAVVSGIGAGESPRSRERHAICMVCDFFYPRMGVRFVFVYVWSVCWQHAGVTPPLCLFY